MIGLRFHDFDSGDKLHLDAGETYPGYRGLKVYKVSYLVKSRDKDGSLIYYSHNVDTYMSKAAALAGFDARLASDNPYECYKQDGGIPHLVLDAFQKYLGDGDLLRTSTPEDWDGFFKHVLVATFSRHGSSFYDSEQVRSTLHELDTTSTEGSGGLADTMLQIPAWKMLEIMTAITALSMALKQSLNRPLSKGV